MASGPNQKNPSKKERQSKGRDRGEFQMSLIERVMSQFEAARSKGNQANEERYAKILRGYDQLTNEQKTDLETLSGKHDDLVDNLATMSGDVVGKMKSVADGTATDVLGDVSKRTDAAAGKYDAATSELGQLAQRASDKVSGEGAAASTRVGEQGTMSRQGVLERGSNELAKLGEKYKAAEGDIRSDIKSGRGDIKSGYGKLAGADAKARSQAAEDVRADFGDQEGKAADRYGDARDTAASGFEDARGRVKGSAANEVAAAGGRGEIGRGTVSSDFDQATADAKTIADAGTKATQEIGSTALGDLATRAEGRLGELGAGYGELGSQAQQQAAATGGALGEQYRSLADTTANQFSKAEGDTKGAFAEGRGRVTGAYGEAAGERSERYGQRTDTGLNMYDQMGDASSERINRQFDEQIERTMGQMEQSLISRGLDSTTIRGQLDRARSDIERNRSEALSQVDAQVRQEKAGAYERMTSQGMSAQDAMQASGLNVDAQMTGAELGAEQNLRTQSIAQQNAMNQAAVGEEGAAMKRGEQAGLQTGLAGLAQQAAGQQGISAAEQAAGRQAMAGALQAQGQGTAAQLGMQGQKAAGLAQLTGQQLDAQRQLSAQGLQGQSQLEAAQAAGQQQLAGQQAGAQQQAGMAGAASGQQMAGQNLAAGTALGQAGLAAQERGQAALEGATQQSRLAGLAAQAQGAGRLGAQDAAMEGARFGALSGLEGQRFGQMAGIESQGLAAQSGNVAQGAAAFDRGQQQASNIQAQLAGQGMGAQTGQMAQGFGTQAQVGSNAISSLERGMQRGDQTKQNTLDFMERKQEDIPSFETAAQLALAAGQSGMGSGGDPEIDPALGKAMDQIGANQRWMQGQMGKQGEREGQNQKFNLDMIKLWGDQRADKDKHVADVEKDREERNAAIDADLRARDDQKYTAAMDEARERESEHYRRMAELEFKKEQAEKNHKEEIKGLTGAELEAVKDGHTKEISAIERGLAQTTQAYETSNQAIIDIATKAVNTPPGQPVSVNVTQSVDGGTTTVEGSSFQGGATTVEPASPGQNWDQPQGSGLPGPDIGVSKGDLTAGEGGYPTMGGGSSGGGMGSGRPSGEVVLDPDGNPVDRGGDNFPTTSTGDRPGGFPAYDPNPPRKDTPQQPTQPSPGDDRRRQGPIHDTNPPRWADTGEEIPPDIYNEIRDTPKQPLEQPTQPTGGDFPTGPFRPRPGESPFDPYGTPETPTTGGGTGLPPGQTRDDNGSIRDKDGNLVNGGFGESPGYDPNELPDPTRPFPGQRDPYGDVMDRFPMDPNPGQQHLDTPIPLEPNVAQDGSTEGMPYKNFAEYQQFMQNQLNPTNRSLRQEAEQRPPQEQQLDEDGLPPEGDPRRPQTRPGWGGGGQRMTPSGKSAGIMAPNVSNRMAAAGGGGLQGLAAQAQGMSAMPPQGGFSNVDDANPRKMDFAGGGQMNQLGDGPEVFGPQGPIIANNNPNQVPGPMQNPQNPQRPEGIGEFNQAEAEANAAAMVNAQGKIDEAAEANPEMQEAMTMMNAPSPDEFWAGGRGHTANVNAGMAQQMADARRLWQEGTSKQQELVDRINQQLGQRGGGGGGGTWDEGPGGGFGGGGGGDTGGGGDDGGGGKRPPVWGEGGDVIIDETGRGPRRDIDRLPQRGDPQIAGGPQIKGMPPGIQERWDRRGGPQIAGGPEEKGKQSPIMQNEKGQWVDRATGFPVDVSAPAPQGGGQGGDGMIVDMPSQGGGQPQSSVTGPSREQFFEEKYAESAARKQQQQDLQRDRSAASEQRRIAADARSKQQSLDNMQRNFDMMTPQQRMQNADQFQGDMDKWQSRYGEGGNTREQVDLFNQIKDGTGSQRLRGFAPQNNPMQFNDRQLREQSDARVQQQQPSLQNLSNQAQGQGANIGQSMSPNQQKVFAKQTQNRIASNRNTPAMQDRRSTGAAMQTSAPSQMASPTMTTKATGMQSGGLNKLANRSKNRMTLPQLYRK